MKLNLEREVIFKKLLHPYYFLEGGEQGGRYRRSMNKFYIRSLTMLFYTGLEKKVRISLKVFKL